MNNPANSPAQNSPQLRHLVEVLLQRYGESVNAILLYGSCLRKNDYLDGLIDLYLIVDNYDTFYRHRLPALANWLLPPNVFYLEVLMDGQLLRAKYAVLSSTDFIRGTSRWFHSYLWGRFAQPTALIYARDEAARNMIRESLSRAVCTFLERTLPHLPESDTVRDLWQGALQLSYGAELRAESAGRAGELVDAALDYYYDVTLRSAASLRYRLTIYGDGGNALYVAEVPPASRRLSGFAWALRRAQGKLLSLLRLLKALFTFHGGFDYIAWKLERHSGKTVEIPERVRRYPFIFIWSFAWREYRRGIFR